MYKIKNYRRSFIFYYFYKCWYDSKVHSASARGPPSFKKVKNCIIFISIPINHIHAHFHNFDPNAKTIALAAGDLSCVRIAVINWLIYFGKFSSVRRLLWRGARNSPNWVPSRAGVRDNDLESSIKKWSHIRIICMRRERSRQAERWAWEVVRHPTWTFCVAAFIILSRNARLKQIVQKVAANFSFPEQHTLARNANWITLWRASINHPPSLCLICTLSLAAYGRGDVCRDLHKSIV